MSELVVSVPVKLVSALNVSEHWRKRAARTAAQRQSTTLALAAAYQRRALGGEAGGFDCPCLVTITRVGPRDLDDDNLAGSAKAVRDAVAEWLGRDDKPGSGLTWRYEQRRPRQGEDKYSCEISIQEVRDAA